MRIGWNGGGNHTSLDAIRAEARRAADDGFAEVRVRGRLAIDAAPCPLLVAAAASTGRPAPRIVAGVPVCVTDDVAAAHALAAAKLGAYGALPAYRAMLAREGVTHPGDLLVAGSEAKVRNTLAEYAAAGTTDLRAGPLSASPGETERTRALLASLACAGGIS
jgi:hypothetical protein